MSKAISIKLKDEVFEDTESIVKSLKIPRNKYINKAIAYYNMINKRKEIAEKFKKEAELVGEESRRVSAEFERIDEFKE